MITTTPMLKWCKWVVFLVSPQQPAVEETPSARRPVRVFHNQNSCPQRKKEKLSCLNQCEKKGYHRFRGKSHFRARRQGTGDGESCPPWQRVCFPPPQWGPMDVGRPPKKNLSSRNNQNLVFFVSQKFWPGVICYVKRFHLRYVMQLSLAQTNFPNELLGSKCTMSRRLRSRWVGPSSYGLIMVTGE